MEKNEEERSSQQSRKTHMRQMKPMPQKLHLETSEIKRVKETEVADKKANKSEKWELPNEV